MRNWSQASLSEKLYWKVSKRTKFTEVLETNMVELHIIANITSGLLSRALCLSQSGHRCVGTPGADLFCDFNQRQLGGATHAAAVGTVITVMPLSQCQGDLLLPADTIGLPYLGDMGYRLKLADRVAQPVQIVADIIEELLRQ